MSEDSGQAADYYYFLLARILQHSGLTDIILQATPNAYYPYSGTEQRKTDAPGASEPCPGPGHGGTAPVLADEHGALLPAHFPGPRLLAARAALLHRVEKRKLLEFELNFLLSSIPGRRRPRLRGGGLALALSGLPLRKNFSPSLNTSTSTGSNRSVPNIVASWRRIPLYHDSAAGQEVHRARSHHHPAARRAPALHRTGGVVVVQGGEVCGECLSLQNSAIISIFQIYARVGRLGGVPHGGIMKVSLHNVRILPRKWSMEVLKFMDLNNFQVFFAARFHRRQ